MNLSRSEFIGIIGSLGYRPHWLNTTTVTFVTQGKKNAYVIYGQFLPDQELMVFIAVLAEKVTKKKQLEVLRYINYVNFSCLFGSMEFNTVNSEVVFRTSLDCKGIQPTPQLIDNLIADGVGAMDSYSPAITLILKKDMDYLTAFDKGQSTNDL
jgi:hypothetical protein